MGWLDDTGLILKRCDLEDWDRYRNGEISLDRLREKYLQNWDSDGS